MKTGPLPRAQTSEACALLAQSLAYDAIATVVEEKLWGDNGRRTGAVVGAWQDNELTGVLATAGRFIKLLAVKPSQRRRGVGTALLAAARANAEGNPLRVADHPGNYLSPGVDERYTDGLAFFEARGFQRVGVVENLRANLADNSQVSEARLQSLTQTLADNDVRVSRVSTEQFPVVHAFIEKSFAPVWALEAKRAHEGPRRALHVAWTNETPVAFAAADGNNQGLGWFGPAGTLLAHRGKGIGEALLIACLLDVRGTTDGGVIAWIGPKPFYERTVGATSDRRFVQLEEKKP